MVSYKNGHHFLNALDSPTFHKSEEDQVTLDMYSWHVGMQLRDAIDWRGRSGSYNTFVHSVEELDASHSRL